MKTEDDACKCWCPFARVTAVLENGQTVAQPHNRIVGTKARYIKSPEAATCIASECMAWRFAVVQSGPQSAPGHPHVGYCGLAGKP